MNQIVAVSLGGATGAVLRWFVSNRALSILGIAWAGTLFVNIVGCFAIGLLYGLADSRNWLTEQMQLFLITGVLGGFTTYSAFGHDAYRHFSDGHGLKGILYVAAHIFLGIGAAWAGALLAR